jgi:hypothetical protein
MTPSIPRDDASVKVCLFPDEAVAHAGLGDQVAGL